MTSNLIKFLKFLRISREVKFELNLQNRQATDLSLKHRRKFVCSDIYDFIVCV